MLKVLDSQWVKMVETRKISRSKISLQVDISMQVSKGSYL